MTHAAQPIAERLEALHEHVAAHETAAAKATEEAKVELLAKIAARPPVEAPGGTPPVE